MNDNGKGPHRQAGVDRVMTSGNLRGVMVSTLAWNTISLGSNPALSPIVPIFITPTTICRQLFDHSLLNYVVRTSYGTSTVWPSSRQPYMAVDGVHVCDDAGVISSSTPVVDDHVTISVMAVSAA